jgi:hypothetical protein
VVELLSERPASSGPQSCSIPTPPPRRLIWPSLDRERITSAKKKILALQKNLPNRLPQEAFAVGVSVDPTGRRRNNQHTALTQLQELPARLSYPSPAGYGLDLCSWRA